GFQSIRAFNDAFQRTFRETPTSLRSKKTCETSKTENERVRLEIAYRPPLAWRELLAFLAARAIPGVESVSAGEYARTFRVGAATGVLRVRALAAEPRVELEVPASAAPELLGIVERVRRLFDLAADPLKVAERL